MITAKTFWQLVILALTLVLSEPITNAQTCPAKLMDIPFASSKATASWFANLRGGSSSLKAQTDLLLDQSKAKAAELSKLEVCLEDCASANLAIIFTSTPNKFLVNYEEFESCQELLEQTTRQPILFENRIFQNEQAFKDWFHDTSQGSGEDGKLLYEICHGSCSPIYSSFIKAHGEQLLVDTYITCGHARDKEDNYYMLNSAFRWFCAESLN